MVGAADPALILDCDGVLADTERYGHLVAFNQTFAEFGLPVRWSLDEYHEKVRIGGRQGAHGQPAHARVHPPPPGCPPIQASQREAVRRVAPAQDRDLHQPGGLRRRPAPRRASPAS